MKRWTAFMVYGGFREPTTGMNFIIVRIPDGRVPWAKKIVPAIERLVRPWKTDARKRYWEISGGETEDGSDLWSLTKPRRFEWSSEGLVER